MIIPFDEIDYLGEARSRVTEQFKDKDVFDRYLQLLTYVQLTLQSVAKDLMQARSIDTAVGAQLDIIGDIVGQERTIIQSDAFPFFGFDEDLTASTFGDVGTDTGGIWYSLGDPLGGNVLLNDERYRTFIKAKIIKNSSSCTPDDFLNFCNVVFGEGSVEISEPSSGVVNVQFTRELTLFEAALVTYIDYSGDIPVKFMMETIGVQFNYIDYV